MKFMPLFLGLVWSSLVFGYEVGGFYKVDILDVRPTQFAAGLKEVGFRMAKIEEKEEDGELVAYKEKNDGKAVIGPDGELYLVDGHHFARALHELGKKSMHVTVIKDYSDLSVSEFWTKMKKKHYVYLRDQNGKALPA